MALILIVDDDNSMRHFISNALERAGHQTVVSSDALSALDTIQSDKNRRFDLLLTDVIMPGMDGIALSKKVSKIDPKLKIMFMTGFSGVVMNRKDLEKDTRMVSKPFHLKDLVNEVEKLIET